MCLWRFAATVWLAWKMAASAARPVAGHAEEADAPRAPEERCVHRCCNILCPRPPVRGAIIPHQITDFEKIRSQTGLKSDGLYIYIRYPKVYLCETT